MGAAESGAGLRSSSAGSGPRDFVTLSNGLISLLKILSGRRFREPRELIRLADQTFASRQATIESSKKLLQDIFALRARRVAGIHAAGRLGWIRETGTRARMLDTVERDLLPKRPAWDDVVNPVDPSLVNVMLEWAWIQEDLKETVRDAYRLDEGDSADLVQRAFFSLVTSWLSGSSFNEMATRANLAMDDLLGVHAQAVTFVLQTLVEQAVALLKRFLESQGLAMSDSVAEFPEHLRFGVPTRFARILAARGVRHRRAAVDLGRALTDRIFTDDHTVLFAAAQQLILENDAGWRAQLGNLVVDNTLSDLS
jgi:helicase